MSANFNNIMTNNDKPFEHGEIIEYAEEQYVVLKNYGNSGLVKNCAGQIIKFHWSAFGEDCIRVTKNK